MYKIKKMCNVNTEKKLYIIKIDLVDFRCLNVNFLKYGIFIYLSIDTRFFKTAPKRCLVAKILYKTK